MTTPTTAATGICTIPGLQAVCASAGKAGAELVTAPFVWLAHAMGAAVAYLYTQVWAAFTATTTIDLHDPAYLHIYSLLFGVALLLTAGLFCIQLIAGLLRRDPTALPRAVTGVAKSVLGAFLVITLTGLLLKLTDQVAAGIITATGTTLSQMGARFAALGQGLAALNIASASGGGIVTIVLASLAISAAAIVWFSLLIRNALLLVAIVFGPIALAGASSDLTRGWTGRWAAFVTALMVSKLALVVIFLLATVEADSPLSGGPAAIGRVLTGIVLMLVGAFAPYLSYRLIAFAGVDLHHTISSEADAKAALNRPIPIPSRDSIGSARRLLAARTAASSATGGGSTAVAAGGAAAGAAATAGIGLAAAAVAGAATAGPTLGRAASGTVAEHTSAATPPVGPTIRPGADSPRRAPEQPPRRSEEP